MFGRHSSESLTAVRFLENVLPYAKGEVAGFPADMAKEFVKSKAAEYFDPKKVEAEKCAEEEDKKAREKDLAARKNAHLKKPEVSKDAPVGIVTKEAFSKAK